LNEASLAADRRPELNRRRLGHRGASRLHRLSEVEADLAARLNPGPQPARLEGHRAKRLLQVSELHRRNLNTVSRKQGDSGRRQDPDKPVVLRTPQIKVKVELWELSAVLHHHQPAQVHVSVAAARSTDSLATANLARRLRVRVPVNRQAEKSKANRE
jgi:hypothetical protein